MGGVWVRAGVGQGEVCGGFMNEHIPWQLHQLACQALRQVPSLPKYLLAVSRGFMGFAVYGGFMVAYGVNVPHSVAGQSEVCGGSMTKHIPWQLH